MVILMQSMMLRRIKKQKLKDFQENFLLRGLVHQNLGNWIRFRLIKVEKHILSNDLMRDS
jgi:hypothetical protein